MKITSKRICTAMLAASILAAGPALAASRGAYDVAVEGLVTYKLPPGSAGFHPFGGPPPTTHFQPGDMVGIMCRYNYNAPKVVPTLIYWGDYRKDIHGRPWTIGLYVDGQKTTQNGHWITSWSKGTTIDAPKQTHFSAFRKWRATPGHHTVRCVLNENGEMREGTTADDRRSIGIDVRIASNVAHMPKFALNEPIKRTSPNGNMTGIHHGPAPMPNAHVKRCPTYVNAVSKIDPHAFIAPFATTSKPIKIPDGHLTLYLKKDEAINDSLFCTYATQVGNAMSTVELSCKDAQLSNKASHSYYCQ